MEWLPPITEILKFTIPTLILVYGLGVFSKKYFDFKIQLEKQRKELEPKKQPKDVSLIKIRMQSYERFALLLERVNPEALVMRLHKPGTSAKFLQTEMLNAVRQEFDHNVAQQIYVSPKLWDIIKSSREETIKLINISADSLDKNATSMDLSTAIFKNMTKLEKLPTDVALSALRKEINSLINQ